MIIIVVLIVAIAGWATYDNVRPRPLGNEMVYLGKEDYGNIFGFDSYPASVYYYETDMDEDTIKEYFNATALELPGLAYKNATFSSSDGEFSFSYESDTDFNSEKKKKYIVTIGNKQYEIARKYLRDK